MKTMTLLQGTSEWHQHRATHFNASDAPAMLGVSPYKTRAQLVREVATGIGQEVDAATEQRFADGHRFEALARPLAEKIIGEELFPCTGSEGKFSASFDGLTLLEDVAWEHKSLNDRLRAAMFDGCTGADLPEDYQVQMEQQAMVSGAEKVLFMASKWDASGNLVDERHCWYTPNPELRARIVAGWDQFGADVSGYVPEPVKAEVVAATVEGFGALSLRIEGRVLASNMDAFKSGAEAFIARLPKPEELQDDQDFADAEQAVKACEDAETKIKAAKEMAQAQMADVDAVFRAADTIAATIRSARLALDKAVKAEKENRRADIVRAANDAYRAHVDGLRAETNGVWLNLSAPDLAGAIKGKRTLSSMRDAVDGVLAQAKIAANESAQHIRKALALLTEETAEHKHLFPDYLTFIAKPVEDIRALVRGRIAEHQQREAERLEQERERIRQEEAERIERERAAQEQAAVDSSHGAATSGGVPHSGEVPDRVRQMTGSGSHVQGEGTPGAGRLATAAAPSIPRLKLGDINATIAPLSITADGLAQLGFKPVASKGAAKMYAGEDFPAMCAALVNVLEAAPSRITEREAA